MYSLHFIFDESANFWTFKIVLKTSLYMDFTIRSIIGEKRLLNLPASHLLTHEGWKIKLFRFIPWPSHNHWDIIHVRINYLSLCAWKNVIDLCHWRCINNYIPIVDVNWWLSQFIVLIQVHRKMISRNCLNA